MDDFGLYNVIAENTHLVKGNVVQIFVGGGNDIVLNNSSAKLVAFGQQGNDFLKGGNKGDILFGGEGLDTLWGLDGNDILFGNQGHNRILGGNGNDKLFGGDGSDWLRGENGNDIVKGGTGSDFLVGDNGNDKIFVDNEDANFVLSNQIDSNIPVRNLIGLSQVLFNDIDEFFMTFGRP